MKGENRSTPRCPFWRKIDSQPNSTHVLHRGRNRTQATSVEGRFSHRRASPASYFKPDFRSTFLVVLFSFSWLWIFGLLLGYCDKSKSFIHWYYLIKGFRKQTLDRCLKFSVPQWNYLSPLLEIHYVGWFRHSTGTLLDDSARGANT